MLQRLSKIAAAAEDASAQLQLQVCAHSETVEKLMLCSCQLLASLSQQHVVIISCLLLRSRSVYFRQTIDFVRK